MRTPPSQQESDPGSTRRVTSEALASLGAAERQLMTRALKIGLWTWPSFTVLDAYMCFVAYPAAPFRVFLLYRIVIELLFLLVYRASLREDANVRRLFRWLVACFSATAYTIALMAIHLGGITSPYMHGISIVALVWAALIPTPWRRGLPTFVHIGLAFPLVMGFGALVSEEARSAWMRADQLIVFVSNFVFVLASSTLGAILSNLVWKAQQQTRRIGSYQLEELLGRGGMGEVWRARHQLLARRAAIKLIRPEALGGDPKARQVVVARFEREAQATALLRSPHTVDLYDFGVSDTGAFYYVMELLVGRDMESLVTDFGQLPEERVLYLLRQVCESLAEAHAVGLVHRDIKPSNLFVCRAGLDCDFVKVLDFGLAKDRRSSGTVTLQTLDHPTGTPAYMAPEIIMGNADVDRRADIYSLGCVAYFLLTGQLVFEANTPMKMLVRHVQDQPTPPSERTELPVSSELDALILSCLEKDPLRRPPDAPSLLAQVNACGAATRWDRAHAREWWERHLPDLCAPLM